LENILGDLVLSVRSLPSVLLDILPAFIPYALVLVLFGAFVVWNGGIVLGEAGFTLHRTIVTELRSGDKSNHIPSVHIPQVYYFVAFSTILGWPVLISGKDGVPGLLHEVYMRMFGSTR
jgi:alpha-1,2-glucosyltransferase